MPVKYKTKNFFKQIYINLCEEDETLNIIGNRYFYILTNNAICWQDMLLLRTKNEIKSKLPH